MTVSTRVGLPWLLLSLGCCAAACGGTEPLDPGAEAGGSSAAAADGAPREGLGASSDPRGRLQPAAPDGEALASAPVAASPGEPSSGSAGLVPLAGSADGDAAAHEAAGEATGADRGWPCSPSTHRYRRVASARSARRNFKAAPGGCSGGESTCSAFHEPPRVQSGRIRASLASTPEIHCGTTYARPARTPATVPRKSAVDGAVPLRAQSNDPASAPVPPARSNPNIMSTK